MSSFFGFRVVGALFLCAALGAVGCGDDDGTGTDAGSVRVDAGGGGGDAGGSVDAGGGLDGAVVGDAGATADGGVVADAGATVDAGGVAGDAGIGVDSGSVDAGPGGAVCGGFGGDTCASTEFCDYTLADICGAADATGICRPRPELCTDIYMPVCGCDGMTYSNACFAHGAGVAVASEGPCT